MTETEKPDSRPNVLFIMTDQQRFDTIASLGNRDIYTPNLDRLVRRGVTMTRAYSDVPVCMPARYAIRTGRSPLTSGFFQNEGPVVGEGLPENTEERCGPYLAHAMSELGYHTFGIGKFHPMRYDEDLGYDVCLRCEERDGFPDDYDQFIRRHPAYDFIEQLHGERTEMYYQPQMSPLPAEMTSESWVADRAIEQIDGKDARPYFGFVSFVGPHPPLAPPVPFNRMYDPDKMRDPILGPDEVDFMDERVPWNSYFVFAEDMSNAHIRKLRARYYGEISFVDSCVGRILDAVEKRPDADNTLICFFADHGEFLGDHHAVQKENFFEDAAHIPMLVSWPKRIKGEGRCDALMLLSDLFGVATTAAGSQELRDGIDILGVIEGEAKPREYCFAFSSAPGTLDFRMMAIRDSWKYVFHANGGGELLFNLEKDPREHRNRIEDEPEIAQELRGACIQRLDHPTGRLGLDGDQLKVFPKTKLKLERVYQFNSFRGVTGFPDEPQRVFDRKE